MSYQKNSLNIKTQLKDKELHRNTSLYSRSCNLPNKSTFLAEMPTPAASSLIDMEVSRQRAAKIKGYLLVFAMFCACIYVYIACAPSPSKDGSAMDNCLQQFRKNNCTLEQPQGSTCIRLLDCIHRGKNVTKAGGLQDKMTNVQEFLQNCLLLLCGMGLAGSITTIILRIRQISRRANLLGKDLIAKIKKMKPLPSKKMGCPPIDECSEEMELSSLEMD